MRFLGVRRGGFVVRNGVFGVRRQGLWYRNGECGVRRGDLGSPVGLRLWDATASVRSRSRSFPFGVKLRCFGALGSLEVGSRTWSKAAALCVWGKSGRFGAKNGRFGAKKATFGAGGAAAVAMTTHPRRRAESCFRRTALPVAGASGEQRFRWSALPANDASGERRFRSCAVRRNGCAERRAAAYARCGLWGVLWGFRWAVGPYRRTEGPRGGFWGPVQPCEGSVGDCGVLREARGPYRGSGGGNRAL